MEEEMPSTSDESDPQVYLTRPSFGPSKKGRLFSEGKWGPRLLALFLGKILVGHCGRGKGTSG